MITKEKNGLEWLEFELFQEFDNLNHAILTRKGGYSSAPQNSLNLNTNSAQVSKDIEQNLQKVKETLSLSQLIWAKQVHGSKINEITPSNLSHSFECDALISKHTKITLLIKHADCQAALFYDPIQKVIANVHCGWRGSVQNIYKKTINEMKSRFNCKPENIYVGISPSLGPKNSEFIHYKKELPSSFWEFQVKPYYFDFWSISKDQLNNCGILNKHLQIAGLDTYSQSELFYSYRKESDTGRNGSFIQIL
ncbi:MAG: Polyphenol oxidase [Chlamydiae bacterium]|nr:Polyphenol oxidase [Chlamydiota bacterium]